MPNGKVLPFPSVREETTGVVFTNGPVMNPVYFTRCAGGCGSLVTSAGALCLRCANDDEVSP